MLHRMFARVVFVLIVLPAAILLAADAPPGGARISVPASTRPRADAPDAASRQAQPLLSQAPAASADPSQCRMSCATANYACHAGDNPDGCDLVWSQCVATCNTPNLDPGITTAP
jgi:hypothetical protein